MRALILLTALVGCGGSKSTTTTFSGTVALTTGQAGTLSVTIRSAVASSRRFSLIKSAYAQNMNANGQCIVPNQPPIDLSGTYDSSNGNVSLSSSDKSTNFNGMVNMMSGSMSGTISDGSGQMTGTFSALKSMAGAAVSVYCGGFSSAGGDSGRFNVQVDANNILTGSAQPTGPNKRGVNFVGKVDNGTFQACSDDPNGPKPICGVIAGGVVTGKFNDGKGDGIFCGNGDICMTGATMSCGALPTCSYPTCQ